MFTNNTPTYPSICQVLLVGAALFSSAATLANTVQQAVQAQQLPPQQSTTLQTKKTGIDLFNLVNPVKQASNQKTTSGTTSAKGKRFRVTGYEIDSDVASVPVSQMLAILDGQDKQSVTNQTNGVTQLSYPELQKKITTLENWLRQEKKLFKASVFMPMQNLASGRVKLVVKQGSVKQVVLSNRFVDKKQGASALAMLQQHIRPAQALTVPELEAAAFHVMEYLKTPVSLVLQPVETGLYNVKLDTAAPPKKIYGFVGVDDLGSDYTNKVKDTFMLGINDVTGHQDALYLSAQLITSNQKMYKVRYEKPFLDGQTVAAQWQRSDYKLCCEFERLNATGTAQTYGLEYSKKLQRSRKRNQTLAGIFEYKQLENKQGGNEVGDASIRLGTLRYTTEWFNQVADNQLILQTSVGNLHLKNPAQRRQDALTASTQGKFVKANLDYHASIPLYRHGLLKGSLSGQWSNKNLNPAEKKSIGGVDAVRALPYGVLVADHAAIAQLAYEYQFSPNVYGSVFVDASTFARNADKWQADKQKNRFSVSGAGAGLRFHVPQTLDVEATVASQLTDAYKKHTGDKKRDKVNTSVQAKWHF